MLFESAKPPGRGYAWFPRVGEPPLSNYSGRMRRKMTSRSSTCPQPLPHFNQESLCCMCSVSSHQNFKERSPFQKVIWKRSRGVSTSALPLHRKKKKKDSTKEDNQEMSFKSSSFELTNISPSRRLQKSTTRMPPRQYWPHSPVGQDVHCSY